MNYNLISGSSGYCGRKALMLSGSAEEGGMLARCFTRNDNKMEIEVDFMMHIGTIDSSQLIPCTRLGFYQFRGAINTLTAIPEPFCQIPGIKELFGLLMQLNYNSYGYFSGTSMKSLLDRETRSFRGAENLFELIGVHVSRTTEIQMTPVAHGPATMLRFVPNDVQFFIKSIEIDGVINVSVNDWPELALEWISRERIWPTQKVIEEIIIDGYFLVNKDPDLDHSNESKCDAEANTHWRLSFSLAEKRLAQERSYKQNYCYFIFKAIFYSKFVEYFERKEMSSYLAKTTFLWLCERLEFNAVEPMEIVTRLFNVFGKYLRDKHLPNYFVPDINLIQSLTEDPRSAVVDIVTVITTELQTGHMKLVKDFTQKATYLLANIQRFTRLTNRVIWKCICKVSIEPTTFLDYLPPAERALAIYSDQRVIGFFQLFSYCVSHIMDNTDLDLLTGINENIDHLE